MRDRGPPRAVRRKADNRPLSGLDAAFLYLEAGGTPMHVGSLLFLQRPPGLRASFRPRLLALLRERLPQAPALRRLLVPAPFALDHPHWQQVADIDLERHVHAHRQSAPGSRTQVLAFVARMQAIALDRGQPLWDVHVLEGLAGGEIAVYTRVHHALLDGQGAVALAHALLDVLPAARVQAPAPVQARVRRHAELDKASGVGAVLLGLPETLRQVWRQAPATVGRLRDALHLAPRTPFNGQVGAGRRVAVGRLPLAGLRCIMQTFEVSLNDVLMSVCGGALREYLQRRRMLPAKSLVAAMPVSLRAAGDREANNQVSMVQCLLHTELADPLARLRAVHAGTRAQKQNVGLLRSLIPTDFPGLAAPLWAAGLSRVWARGHLAEHLPPLANLTISNVPGSPLPLALAGARVLANYPISTIYHGLALNITAQSYADDLDIGIVADRDALPNPAALMGAIERAYAHLLRLAELAASVNKQLITT